jgi:hypothetical protein
MTRARASRAPDRRSLLLRSRPGKWNLRDQETVTCARKLTRT